MAPGSVAIDTACRRWPPAQALRIWKYPSDDADALAVPLCVVADPPRQAPGTQPRRIVGVTAPMGEPSAAAGSAVPAATIALLVAAAGLGPLSMGLFVPSMPGLQTAFDTDYGHVQLTLSLYLVGLAFGQLLYGPLSDRFGRKPVMVAGLAVFAAASVGCAAATSIGMLIAARFVQALGGCVGIVLGRAVIRDLVPSDRAASGIAYMTVALLVAPMLGPLLGGQLDDWLGWRAGFVLVAVGSVVTVAAVALALPETQTPPPPTEGAPDRRGFWRGPAGLLRPFASVLAAPRFLAYATICALTMAAMLAFMAGGPYVTVDLMGHSAGDYGWLFAIAAGGYMAGNLIAGRMSARVGVDRMITVGTALAFVATAAMAAFVLTDRLDALTLFGPLTLMALGNGLTMPNGLAGAVGSRPDLAGTASGLAGFLQMALGALASFTVGKLLGPSALPLVLILLAVTLAALVLHALGARRRAAPGPANRPA